MRIVSRQPNDRRRMGELACLPVFFTLKGKSVLVAGGSEAAAWKAELLAAAGAKVHVFADDNETIDDMRELADAGVVALHDSSWEDADWSIMALAVGDCGEEEAQGFVDRAFAESVPVNVIDKPAFCQFQFGSIVNRSPVVVGISTNGAAPILGQAVRRRIETLLPKTLAAWAQLAQTVRARVTEALAPGAERRAFWERLSDYAFRADPGDNSPEGWIEKAQSAPAGRVTLVGAGPGDAEYLTIKAVRALQAADVILFDDLVSDDVLELARREAKRILVGKRGGRQSCKQDDINAMMLSLARQGRNVVRLKSGDPMIFGRAGEEIAALEAADIPLEVVPGISTAFALAAQLGISLTHRDHAQSVRFVTGHARNGRLPGNLDWTALADPATTHVYYMAGRTSRELAGKLAEAGLALSTPLIVASSVSRPEQTVAFGTLAQLRDGAINVDFSQPTIIAIGAAVAQRGAVLGDAPQTARQTA
ncbi:siroheme synthase CysG [Pelagibacterium xiamenense]|uniref:siroheme synthase CysG n=1 Tax=Pelagibacterium xiamenense TaxID=2901140 RepID=UPI001E5EE841|nr:siroheme synthase CysG [Pelagibacterium xiamenense]MCD7059029.1 siroheme synthase CysG [Pelagibacterium xiamenense]